MAKDPSPVVSAFPPHRRRHLQSQTYKTLVRILSLCGELDRVPGSVRSSDCPGNVETGAQKNVEGRAHNQADSARPDDEYPRCSNIPEDSLENEKLEGAICDKNRGSSNEQSMVNDSGHMMSIDEHGNYSPRHVDKMVGDNCAVGGENNNNSGSLVSVQGHYITPETTVIKEDPSINCADASLEKLTDGSDFQQTAVEKSIGLSHQRDDAENCNFSVSAQLQGNTNDEKALEKRHVEDAFKGTDENEELILGKNSKVETRLPVREPKLSVKGNFALKNDHDKSFDLPRDAGNDLADLGGQLADVDKLKPGVPEPFDIMDEFELEDTVMDNLRMIFDDDQALVRADDGMTEATSAGTKDSAGVDAFRPVKLSDLQDLLSDEQAHVDEGQEEADNCSEKVFEGSFSACGGQVSATTNASVSIDASIKVQQLDRRKLEMVEQMEVSNLQKASDSYSKKGNSLCKGHVFVSQSTKEKSLLFGTGSPLAVGQIQLDTVLSFSEGNLSFPSVKTEKEEVEEGEISDGVEGTGSPLDFSSCHANTATDKIETMPLSGCLPSLKHRNCQEQPASDGPHFGSFSSMSNGMSKRVGDAARSDMERTVFETQMVLHGKSVVKGDTCRPAVKDVEVDLVRFIKEGEHSEADLAHGISTENTGTVASEKGTDIDKKRKRSCLSEQRKEKRKIKKREKRAQKNRELGVKRLKLPPMLPPKPKPVSVCRHFLKGRCQEGGNCKFSHDAVPLTKSKPCCHFARNACMKGDDCPFDHELSKYPCNNFASSGYCSRGNSCLFSHKILPTDSLDLAQDDGNKSKSTSKLPASPVDLGLSKPTGGKGGTHGNALVSRTPGSSDIAKQNLTNLGKSQTHEVKRNAKSVERSVSVSSVNPSDCLLSSSRTVKSGPDIGTSRTPMVAPKGINFLSFGVSPMDKPNPKKPISSDLALKLSALSSSLNAQRTEDSSQCINASASNVMPKDSAPERIKSLTENIKVTPQPEFKSLGKALSIETQLAGDAGSDFSANSNIASSSTISKKVLISTIGSAQSSDFSTPSPVKGTSASIPRASPYIFSGNAGTELFGGNHFIFPGANGETSHGVSLDDSAKSLRILDFLASIGKKR